MVINIHLNFKMSEVPYVTFRFQSQEMISPNLLFRTTGGESTGSHICLPFGMTCGALQSTGVPGRLTLLFWGEAQVVILF